MKILLILTGGTIACKIQNNTLNTTADTAYDILRLYKKENPNCNIEFTTVQPFTILSENYTANTYNTLIDFLYNCDFNSYKGVIITHGSDTLSYTSALVGMLLRDVNIPVLLTAADYPLSEPRSNGLSNFSACVEFIKNDISNGVFTAYGEKNNTQIYLSTRICEADPLTDSFTPFGNGIIAQAVNNKICNVNKDMTTMLENKNNRLFTTKPVIKNSILLIKTYPNQNFDCYSIDNISAVVVYLYHSATACTTGNCTDICSFIKRCNSYGKPVYLASFKKTLFEYATSCEMEKHNVHKLYNISKESAYIKALLAHNQTEFSPEDVMNTNIYFESSIKD